jgi:multidrug efflux pump subunit AcrA (membrane-fusion protein)
VSAPIEDEGSFASGRQALLDALSSLEQRAHDRAEQMVRDAEREARQLTLDSEQRAYQVTSEAEQRARQTIADAEQRAKQVTLETASRLAELEQQLSEVRDNLEAARAQLEEQVVSVRGQVEVARASVNTVRERLTTGGTRASDARGPHPARLSIPPLSSDRPLDQQPGSGSGLNPAPPPVLNDLRAAVDALKRPRLADLSEADSLGASEAESGSPEEPRAAL